MISESEVASTTPVPKEPRSPDHSSDGTLGFAIATFGYATSIEMIP